MKNLIMSKCILFVLVNLFYTIQVFSQMAAGRFKFVGNIAADYPADDYLSYWNQLSPKNVAKWGSVEQIKGAYYWTPMDHLQSWCQQNSVPLKYHTLVWYQGLPSWISGLTTADQLVSVDKWFGAASTKYPTMEMIDVVNEATHGKPSYYLSLGGDGVTGWDWVITSFQKARALFPNALLLINDYHVEDGGVINSYINIIKLLKSRNLIDGIGCQGHFLESTSATTIKSNLDKLALLNLPVYITELDVVDTADAGQLSKMQKLFPVFWTHPAVKGITFQGYLSNWRGVGGILKNGSVERPALTWLKDYVSNAEKIAPTVPQNFRFERYSTDTLLLKWQPSNDNVGIAGYEIFNGSRIVATVAAKDSTQKVYCPATGIIPDYKIRAFDVAANASNFTHLVTVDELNQQMIQDFSIDVRVSRNGDKTFNIQFSGDQTANILLTDISGKIISKYVGVVSGQQLQIPAVLSKGMVILSVEINGVKISRKLNI